MSQELVLAILGSAGFTAIIGAVVNAIFNRRKLSAEATQIITQAAAGTVENVMKDNAELRLKIDKLEIALNKMQGVVELSEQRERINMITEERYRWHMQQWHRYAATLADEIRRLGGHVGDSPPDWPEPVALVRTRPDKIAFDASIEEG